MWDAFPTEALWRTALAVIPLVLVVALVCRSLPRHPAVRHSLWLMVMFWLVAAPMLPSLELSAPRPSAPVTALPLASDADDDSDFVQPDPPTTVAASRESVCNPELECDRLPAMPTLRRELPAPGRVKQPEKYARGGDQPQPAATDASATRSGTECGQRVVLNEEGANVRPDCVAQKPIVRAPRTGSNDKATKPGVVLGPENPRGLKPAAHRAGNPRGLKPAARCAERESAPAGESSPHESAVAPAPPEPTIGPTPQLTPSTSQAPPGARRLSKRNSPAAAHQLVGTKAPARGGPVLTSSKQAPPPATPARADSKRAPLNQSVAPSRTQVWLAALVGIRDAVGQLPPIPAPVWVLGIGALALLKVSSVLRFQRRLQPAYPAPAATTQLVAETARRLGLKRLPETKMLDAAVSPMVWQGRRPTLVLPRELWSQLDDASRRAVLCHELAHLRRLDHWVCWAEAVIGCLYWWHPLVWWVRRQLHTEAELSCDAWVTWLIPRGRTAYAQALLQTKSFVGRERSLPPLGFGMARGRAAKFGRRLKMVMTQRSRPRQSVFGLTLVFALAAIGWVAVPAHSGPPEHTGGTSHAETPKAGHDAGLDQRVERLEQQLDKLTVMLEQLARKLDGESAEQKRAQITSRQAIKEQVQRARPAPQPPAKPSPPAPPTKKMREPRLPAPQPPDRAAPARRVVTWDGGDEHEVVVYAYGLPGHELKKLGALMLRPDVPIPVALTDEAVEVHATLPQHSVFAGFVEMIHPEAELPHEVVALSSTSEGETLEQRYQLPKEKLAGLYELMALPDVPVLVSSSDGSITVIGTASQQNVFRSFAELVDTGAAPLYPRAPKMPEKVHRAQRWFTPGGQQADNDETTELSYSLPQGKRQALWDLMALPDVPILVSRQGGMINVQATPAQHSIFAGFVRLIQPGARLSDKIEAMDSSDVGPRVERDYPLPDHKLQALWELMQRSDVPLLVSQGKKDINVQGTASQQSVFAAFVKMIHPQENPTKAIDMRQVPFPTKAETTARAYVLPQGKLEALTALMVRQDVPVLVSPGDTELVVHATPAQHEAFTAFVKLINPDPSGKPLDFYTSAVAQPDRVEEIFLKTKAHQKAATMVAKKCKEQAKRAITSASTKAQQEYQRKLEHQQQEHQIKRERQKCDQERQKCDQERRKCDQERQKCEQERRKCEQERQVKKAYRLPRAKAETTEPSYRRALESGSDLLHRGIATLGQNFDLRAMLERAAQTSGETPGPACSE